MSKPLTGKICLVTGGSRGVGRGIALQLGEAGATVYVTGRTLKRKKGSRGSLEETAEEIEARGGVCVPVVCDHGNDAEVKALFDRISRERDGQLDILVNNAYSAFASIFSSMGVPFWEQDDNTWDAVNNVGLRNHYLCTVHAARMMVPRRQGLIVNISSLGGLRYLFNVPYGIGKTGVDRMAGDCAIELRTSKVTMVSLWPGTVKTEMFQDLLANDKEMGSYYQPGVGQVDSKRMKQSISEGQSPEFAGRCVVQLALDPDVLGKTGRTLLASELGAEYHFTDIDGRTIPSLRSIPELLHSFGWKKMALCFPRWLKIPYAFITLSASKF